MIKKPMLACDRYLEDEDVNALEFPMIASPKVDGIRCINPDGRVLSRSFKPIKNDHIRTTLEQHMIQFMDGELFAGDSFQKCTSAVMSQDGEPEFVLRLFDYVPGGDTKVPYTDRLKALVQLMKNHVSDEAKQYIKMLPFKVIESVDELRAYEKQCLDEGFEGVILRTPDGPYKCGRSTWRERFMLKLKIFVDSEAEVIGFEEQMTNTNELETDELGHAKRSSAKAGKIPNGHLGKFIVKDINGHFEGEFRIGSAKGMTKEMRKEIWENQDQYLGKIVKYKYQPQGVKDLPRIPIWLGFRDKDDM
jgi:DNA ligase-1